MRKLLISFLTTLMLALVCVPAVSVKADASVYINDQADLLTDAQEADLYDVMEPITEYGGVAFVTVSSNLSSTSSLAERLYRDYFGTASGTLFIIDMDNRQIYIFSDGAIYKRITKSYANTITDNVYKYATNGDYYTCAEKTFSQIYTLLDGGRIAQPMKYISNALIALIAAFLINFIIIKVKASSSKTTKADILRSIFDRCAVDNATQVMTHQTKTYSPPSSSGGGGHGGGGGGGGGGHSGGGGGHGF